MMKNTTKRINKNTDRHNEAVKMVINDILLGATYSVLFAKLRGDLYGLDYKYSKTQSEKIIRDARKVIQDDIMEQMPSLVNDNINRLLDIFTECREMGDRLGAMKAVEIINKMAGITTDRLKVDANIKQEITIDFGYDKEDSSEGEGD